MKDWKYKAQLNIKFLECYFKTTLLLPLLCDGLYYFSTVIHYPFIDHFMLLKGWSQQAIVLKVLTSPQALIPTRKCRVRGHLHHYAPFSNHGFIRRKKALLGLTQEHLPTFSLSLCVWLGKSQEVQLPPSNFGNKHCKRN